MPDETSVAFDPDRVVETLDRHAVEYLLVGGLAARAHGARRQTADVDCVPNTTVENLGRLAAALLELNARLRVGGLTDDDARNLPVAIDAQTLLAFGSSTWMTDAGPLDLLVEMRDRDGGRHDYADLVTRAVGYEVGEVSVRLASLGDIVASTEFADRPRTTKRFRNCANCSGASSQTDRQLGDQVKSRCRSAAGRGVRGRVR